MTAPEILSNPLYLFWQGINSHLSHITLTQLVTATRIAVKIYVLGKNKKKITIFHMKIINFNSHLLCPRHS